MRRLWPLVFLAACATEPVAVPQQGGIPGLLRNPTAPLASQVDVTAERLAGTWYLRQYAGVARNLSEEIIVSEFDADGVILQAKDVLCSDETGLCYEEGVAIDLAAIGPGRWQIGWPSGGFQKDPVWVHWMDFDGRTVAIGGPTGKFVWIMDRATSGGADRIAAAREILEWYGYDLSQLETVQ